MIHRIQETIESSGEMVINFLDLFDLPTMDELQNADIIDFLDSLDLPTIDELQDVEFDRNQVKKVTQHAKILSEILEQGTIYDKYGHPSRTRLEIEGGYRIARERGARLDEVLVFRMMARFKNSKCNNMDALAFAYKSKIHNEEWIVLLPDDTMETLNKEKDHYSEVALLYEAGGKINRKQRQHIEENLERLNIRERCAQTLMHEYGHILHMRLFQRSEKKNPNFSQYIWFQRFGYTDLIDRRNPLYHLSPAIKKLNYLKECLVEDYRIFLNKMSTDDMFILPGKFTFAADLVNSDLLTEGVNMMRKMLNLDGDQSVEDQEQFGSVGSDLEEADFDMMEQIFHASLDESWVPGQRNMTKEDHEQVGIELLLHDKGLNVKSYTPQKLFKHNSDIFNRNIDMFSSKASELHKMRSSILKEVSCGFEIKHTHNLSDKINLFKSRQLPINAALDDINPSLSAFDFFSKVTISSAAIQCHFDDLSYDPHLFSPPKRGRIGDGQERIKIPEHYLCWQFNNTD